MRGLICACGWLTLMGAAGGQLQIHWSDDGLSLDLTGTAPGRNVLYTSTDLIAWDPVYSFMNSGALPRLNLPMAQSWEFLAAQPDAFSIPPAFVWVPPGEFVMGSSPYEAGRDADEGPQRVVRINRGFWVSRYEVTVREYFEIMGHNPSVAETDSSRPVENISLAEAMAFCERRTQRDRVENRIPPACVYRLPSEAEWEYVCRAGTQTRFSFGDDPGYTQLERYSWSRDNALGRTHPVGSKLPNPWGLYDVHGNVFEWCLDPYAPYPGGAREGTGRYQVYRGGAYYCPPDILRCASRHPSDQVRSPLIGLRLVLGGPSETVAAALEVAPLQAHLHWSADRTAVTVTASTPTPGAEIYYTTNTVEPYSLTGTTVPPSVTAPALIKAAAFKFNHTRSPTLEIQVEQLPPPSLRIEAGQLSATSPVPGAEIQYAIAEGAWMPYTGPLTLSGSGVVQARLTLPGFLTSVPAILEF